MSESDEKDSQPPILQLIHTRQPQQIIRRLPKDLLLRIDRALKDLARNPRPAGCLKLTGYQDLYQIRVGDWRIIYSIDDDQLIIVVLEIAPRGGAYRSL